MLSIRDFLSRPTTDHSRQFATVDRDGTNQGWQVLGVALSASAAKGLEKNSDIKNANDIDKKNNDTKNANDIDKNANEDENSGLSAYKPSKRLISESNERSLSNFFEIYNLNLYNSF